MITSFDIIRGLPEHASILTDITIKAKRHWGYPEKWMQQWIPLMTISVEYILENEVWMVVVDNKPIGYYSLKQDVNELWLDNLWVLPEYMGQGIGKQLCHHAFERSRMRGMSILKIEADPNAQSFYEKMGAHKVDEHQSEVDGQLRILPVMEIEL
ncbi:MAG: GNAT family N-acetyltransferase [Anaerolineales bacterium]|nr:GNAT family N-acetyltransferase [Anaerolineales bacterium]